MPRYHFHLADGGADDEEGCELPDLAAARRAAVELLGQSLADRADAFWREGEWLLTVTDPGGLTLFTLRVFAADAPSVPPAPALKSEPAP